MNQPPSMLKAALISGAVFGVAGAIPVINWLNCACCALIVGCGFFAAYLYSKDSRAAGVPFRGGNGATIGLFAGLIYGVISGILGGLINAAFIESSGSLVMLLIGLFFALLFGAIFGAIGGLIGGSVFKVEVQPVGGSTQPPPPPPPVG